MNRQPRSSPRSTRNQRTVSIIGTGSYAPDKILTNEDLSHMVDTSDEWITTRTGIKERRIAAKDEMTSDMATKAALKALEQAQISPEDVQLLLVATATPDMIFPRRPVSFRKDRRQKRCLPRCFGRLRRILGWNRDCAAVHYVGNVRHCAGDRCGQVNVHH